MLVLKKTPLQQGISELVFYGDLVCIFKRIIVKPNFSDQFKETIKRYKKEGYNMDIMRQSACLVVNPITMYSYDFLLNCLRLNDGPAVKLEFVGQCLTFFVGWAHRGSI